MAAPKGHPQWGGRKKGTLNRLNSEANQRLAELDCDPIEGMVKIALGEVPCSVCRGKGRTKYQPAKGKDKLAERTCESCYGSGKEIISPELKGKMFAELAQYVAPKRKAVEHTGLEGGPIDVDVRALTDDELESGIRLARKAVKQRTDT